MAVRSLDCPVLMGDAAIVAGRRHTVMSAEILVSTSQIVLRILVEIAEGSGQTVGPMLSRRSAERPQGILQSFGQGHEALATEHHMGVLKPGIGEPEVVKAMIERHPCDSDTQLAHLSEVGQARLAGFVSLAKDDFLLLAVDRPPGADSALQRATDSGPELGMAP